MGPPLNPIQQGFAISAARSPICVELFLDLICPFSSKMFQSVYCGVVPSLPGDTPVNFVVQQVPQPWHPQGTYVHEAALAVKQVAPAAYPDYLHAVYTAFDAGKFKDDDTWGKTRGQIYADLIDLLQSKESLKAVDAAAVAKLLEPSPGGGNAGTPMTQHIKWAAKYHRTRGVHVTPTVHINGLEAGIVSSGWSPEQWKAFLEPLGADNWQGSKLQLAVSSEDSWQGSKLQ